MKTTSTILVFLTGFTVSWAQAAEPPPVDKVVVYADRAEVTRAAMATCKSGKADVSFPLLPVDIDERTLRAEASGKARAIGLTSRVVPLEEDRDARVAALQKQILALIDEMRILQETAAGHAERVNVVTAFGTYFQQLLNEEVRNARPDPRQWSRILDDMRRERLQAGVQQNQIGQKLRALTRKKERLDRRLSALRPQRVAEARTVKVAVACKGETRPRVTLAYVVPGATWHPEYDLRFLPRAGKVGKGKAELTVAAVVQQSTGEDWENAKLILSTSKPRLGSEAPYPAPLYVNGREVGEEKELVATMERRDQLAGPAGATTASPAGAVLQDRGQSFALTLPRRVTVRADGRPYWMPVDVVSTSAEAKLVTVPKIRPFVYHVVKLKNPAAYPLLQGRLHAYRAGSYVGDAHLEYKAPGEPMEVSLGIDEEFKVERKALHEVNRSASFLSSTKHLERSWRIRLTNRARRRQAVEIRENYPVSKTEDVEIEVVKEKTTRHYKIDRHRGFITWTVRVDPAREKTVDLAYTIHLPEDWKVRVR